MALQAQSGVDPPLDRQRRALIVACVGNAVEYYDFALYAGFSTVLTAVLTPGGWAGFATVFAVFAVSCLFRPLGSLVFGLRADRSGRRPALAGTIVLMAVSTAAIGLLPPWAVIGAAAPVCLLGLRAAQAYSAGGEIGVSVAYLTEVSPPGQRGRYGQWCIGTAAAGLAAGLGVTALTAALLDPAALAAWGWRIPFLFALPLGAIGLFLRRRQIESPLFVAPTGKVRVAKVLKENLPTVRRCFLLAAAFSAAFNVWFLFLPSYLTTTGTISLVSALISALTGLVAAALTAPLFGHLSDRVGRRPVLIGANTTLAVVLLPLYLWTGSGSVVAAVTGSVVVGVILSAFVLPAFLAEQFPTRVRSTGLGLAYGLGSALVGGTAPLVATILSRLAPVAAVPAYLTVLVLAALAATIRLAEKPEMTAAAVVGES